MILDSETRAYLRTLGAELGRLLGSELSGVFLGGSIALGDYAPERSDVDLFVIVERDLPEELKRALVDGLRYESHPCPAQGLELTVFRAGTVRKPPRVVPYELLIMSGESWEPEISFGGQDSQLLVDLAICRDHGVSLFEDGPTPAAMFAPVSREWLLEVMKRSVEWHLDHIHHPFHDPKGHYTVLNTCRAWRYAEESVLSSKLTAGKWALERRPEPVVKAAVALREGERVEKLDGDEARAFAEAVLASKLQPAP